MGNGASACKAHQKGMQSPARLPSIAAPSVPDDITFDLNNRGKESGLAKAVADRLHLEGSAAELAAAAQGSIGRLATSKPECIQLQPLGDVSTLVSAATTSWTPVVLTHSMLPCLLPAPQSFSFCINWYQW